MTKGIVLISTLLTFLISAETFQNLRHMECKKSTYLYFKSMFFGCRF